MWGTPILTIPPAILCDEDLVCHWLSFFSWFLCQDHRHRNAQGKFQFTSAQEECLHSLTSGRTEEILDVIEILKKAETEVDDRKFEEIKYELEDKPALQLYPIGDVLVRGDSTSTDIVVV